MRHAMLMRLACAVALALPGCANDAAGGSGDDPTPPMQGGGGSGDYPKGPYGVKPGTVIANYKFSGFADPSKSTSPLQIVALGDLYNPTGKGLFPKGSQYGEGKPLPKAIVVDVGSVWCGPCNLEAGNYLPKLHTKYLGLGGEFFEQLVDGSTQGQPATEKNLIAWSKKYRLDYPATIDPSYQLGAVFQADAFPGNMIIDTRTMKICHVITSAPDPDDGSIGTQFWAKLDAVLADSSACN